MMRKKETGSILKVKEGYNPNSSSIGSIVFSMPAVLLWTVPLFGLGAASAAAWFSLHRKEKRRGRRR